MSLALHDNRPQLVTSPEIAGKLVEKLGNAMEDLLLLLREETALVKAGKLRQAGEFAMDKEEKAALYTRLMLAARDEIETLKAFVPVETAALLKRHEMFRSEVQINLAVLDTARDVAEDILRTVATEVGRTEAPATYGRGGHPQAVRAMSARGVAVNRSL
ncbi:MAG: hypothetical protein H6Q99_3674 [Proteobacteria bacterium]|nr:hypothetical protein [Pseudomonadota bacterium]